MSNPVLSHLNDPHTRQLLSYLKYFKNKREQQLREIDHTFSEIKDMRLLEEMYTNADVENLLNGLRDVVYANVQNGLEGVSLQAALYLRHICLQAEGHGITLEGDLGLLDDQTLLKNIKRLEEGKERPFSEAPPQRLASLTGAVDVKLVAKIKDLEESNNLVAGRFEKLQDQCKASLQENARLKQENTELRRSLQALGHDLEYTRTEASSAQAEAVNDLQHKIERLAAKEKEANDILQHRLNESPQFQELKKLVQKKNQLIKHLRAQLEANGIDASDFVEDS